MNLPTPQLPTDNLYKFIAIAGLVFVVMGVVVPLQLQNQIDRDHLPVARAVERMTAATTELRREVEAEWDALAHASTTQPSSRPYPSPTSTQSSTSTDRMHQLRVEADEAMNLVNSYRVGFRNATRIVGAAVIGGVVGIAMMIFGFARWYQRVQKYQDIILAAEAAKATREAGGG